MKLAEQIIKLHEAGMDADAVIRQNDIQFAHGKVQKALSDINSKFKKGYFAKLADLPKNDIKKLQKSFWDFAVNSGTVFKDAMDAWEAYLDEYGLIDYMQFYTEMAAPYPNYHYHVTLAPYEMTFHHLGTNTMISDFMQVHVNEEVVYRYVTFGFGAGAPWWPTPTTAFHKTRIKYSKYKYTYEISYTL